MTEFTWDRSNVIGLAKETCAHCQGLGMQSDENDGAPTPCKCVLRGIFRACFRRFRYLATTARHMSQSRAEHTNGRDARIAWGRRNEEYLADFCNTARRHLSPTEHRIFRFHYLLGGNWKLCCRRLNMDRGTFFHEVYRIEEKLGRVLRELQPYALFPLDEYFGGTVRGAKPARTPTVIEMPILRRTKIDMPVRKRLAPPVRKVA
ncbi:MAG: hypothetical protein KGN84_21275 [Acidobacteriota bacterium]|nr:hypothetical protein [Acidobacteriota bacterium]